MEFESSILLNLSAVLTVCIRPLVIILVEMTSLVSILLDTVNGLIRLFL